MLETVLFVVRQFTYLLRSQTLAIGAAFAADGAEGLHANPEAPPVSPRDEGH